MADLVQKIKALATKHYDSIWQHRCHLHAHPELSFEEQETARYIARALDKLGVTYREGLGGGTGLTAEIGKGSKMIGLRADIDALPITESSDKAYISTNVGVMHACGHDVHTSSLLGVAAILKDLEDDLNCKYRLIFQPGEEKLPGGASLMIKDDVLQGLDAIVGQHVDPSIRVGHIGMVAGSAMASCDEIYITITGRGGHAAIPHQVIDPILISAEVIQSLQTVISRYAKPHTPSVLSIGKINSDGGATNVIPEKVMMEGTFRTYDEDWRQRAHEHIHTIINSICQAHGATAEVQIVRGYPSLYNDPQLTDKVSLSATSYVGREKSLTIEPRMTAEDFSYYSHEIPACFYRLGTASADGSNSSPVHTPTFDVDPKSVEIGSGFMAYTALMLSDKIA